MEGSFLKILAGWFKKFERYKVSYKNGSYELRNLFHSPQTIVDSFEKMWFCQHDSNLQLQLSDSIFLKSKMYYCNPEEDFWLIISNLYFKKNVLMRNLYDEGLPLEYHFINIHIKTKTVVNKSMVNGLILKDKTWSVFKAGHALTEYHFKESEEKNITVFVTDKWLEKQKATNPKFKDSKLIDFFNSPNTYLILDESNPEYEKMCDEMMRLADEGIKANMEKIKQMTYDVLGMFIDRLNHEVISENHFKLSDKDRKNIKRAQQYLMDSLLGDFPGIEKIASKTGISPSKLKSDFKSMHDSSVYQYFSAHQMQLAYDLLRQNKHEVKEVALLFGYENASKFTAKFFKEFGVMPSHVAKSQLKDVEL